MGVRHAHTDLNNATGVTLDCYYGVTHILAHLIAFSPSANMRFRTFAGAFEFRTGTPLLSYGRCLSKIGQTAILKKYRCLSVSDSRWRRLGL